MWMRKCRHSKIFAKEVLGNFDTGIVKILKKNSQYSAEKNFPIKATCIQCLLCKQYTSGTTDRSGEKEK